MGHLEFFVLNDEKIQPWQNTGGGIKFNKKTTAKIDVPNACSHGMVHLGIFERNPIFRVTNKLGLKITCSATETR